MDARSEKNAIPLAVDLDGTLIATDLLWEGLFLLLRRNPLYLFMVPVWLLSGPARLKQELAARIDIDPAGLPYRETLVERLREDRAGRPSHHPGHRHAAQIRRGDRRASRRVRCRARDRRPCTISPSKKKCAALVEAYGDGGFDYAGNSRHDLACFDVAREAIVVAPDRHAARWQSRHSAELFETPKPTFKTYLKMLRAHQWAKNVLIAVPMVLSHEYFNIGMLAACLLAFVSFSAAASSVYIVNDFFDLALDRKHPTKRKRPFASGMLSIPFGLASAAGCLPSAPLPRPSCRRCSGQRLAAIW